MFGLLLQVQNAANDLTTNALVVDGEATEIRLSVLELAMKGGWIMAVLAVFSIIAVYVFVNRYVVISRATKYDKSFMNSIREYIVDGKLEMAQTLCRSNKTPIARMIEKGISRIGRPLNDINAAIENVGKLEVSRLEKGVAGLATIAGASPMLGFLGTVIGMIRAFYDMSMAGNNIDIALLSSGIYQAMVTTVGGLIVGILAYIFYNVLVSRVEKVIYLVEAQASEFMDVLYEPAR